MGPIVHARKFCARITHSLRRIRVASASVLHDILSSRRQHARFRLSNDPERAILAMTGSISLDNRSVFPAPTTESRHFSSAIHS